MTVIALLIGSSIGHLLYQRFQQSPHYDQAWDRIWWTALGILLGWWICS